MNVFLKVLFGGILLCTLIFLTYVGVVAYSYHSVDVGKVRFEGFEDVDLDGFTVDSSIIVDNSAGWVPVTVESIEYELTMQSNGDRLGTGEIGRFTVPAGKQERVNMDVEASWGQSIQITPNLVTDKPTYVDMEGTIHLLDVYFLDIDIPFSNTINIEDAIEQAVERKAEQVAQQAEETADEVKEAVEETAETVGETVKDAANTTWNTVTGWID